MRYGQCVLGTIFADNVVWVVVWSLFGDNKTMPLAKRKVKCTIVIPNSFSFLAQHLSSLFRNIVFQKILHIKFPDKTNNLTVFSFGIGKPQFLGKLSYFRLLHIPYRKKYTTQLLLSKSPQKIALIFIFIYTS